MSLRLTKAEVARLGIKLPKKEAASGNRKKKSVRHAHSDLSHLSQDVIELSFPIRPKVKERPRFSVDEKSVRRAFTLARGNVEKLIQNIRVRTVTSKATKDFEKEVAKAASVLMMGRKPLEGPIEIYAQFILPGDPEVWPMSRVDGDLDNHEKAFFDALNDIVYRDDCLIVRKFSEKIFGGKGAAEIKLYAAPATNPTSLRRYLFDD